MSAKSAITPQFAAIKTLLTAVEQDVAKFDKGNYAAGTRVRKAMQQLKADAQGIRETVLLK